MTMEMIRETLGWCAVINMGLILYWFLMIIFAGDWVYRMHSKFIPITREQFHGTHYAGLAIFKIGVFVFNIVPYLALRIVG